MKTTAIWLAVIAYVTLGAWLFGAWARQDEEACTRAARDPERSEIFCLNRHGDPVVMFLPIWPVRLIFRMGYSQ